MSLRKVVVDFDRLVEDERLGDSAVACRDWLAGHVKPGADDKILLVLKNTQKVSDKIIIPVLERWSNRFPGRVFLLPETCDTKLGQLIQNRFPQWDDSVVFSGRILMASSDTFSYIPIKISKGVRPERLPTSEDLFLVCRLEESEIQTANIPIQGLPMKCVLGDDLISLNNCVVVSGDAGRIFSIRDLPDDRAELLCIQNEQVANQLYFDAVKQVNRGSYIRGLSVGHERVKSQLNNSAVFDALITRKQLNVLRTVELLETRLAGIFDKKSSSEMTKSTQNFEHRTHLKATHKTDQSRIYSILKNSVESGTTLEEMIHDNKRIRRIVGTSFNSYRWPNEPVQLQLFDGALLSEVLGGRGN
jgi:hypothetical protein